MLSDFKKNIIDGLLGGNDSGQIASKHFFRQFSKEDKDEFLHEMIQRAIAHESTTNPKIPSALAEVQSFVRRLHDETKQSGDTLSTISPTILSQAADAFEKLHPDDKRPEVIQMLRDRAKNPDDVHRSLLASSFWNQYESSVENFHFPIIHAAMTGQHQRHLPYRKDKAGGEAEYISSEGHEHLFAPLQEHAKLSQATILRDDVAHKNLRKGPDGEIQVKVFRGIGGQYANEVQDAHEAGNPIAVAPVQSWTLHPPIAHGFAERNADVGTGVNLARKNGRVISAWVPLKNIVHYGRMKHEYFTPLHDNEHEVVVYHPERTIKLVDQQPFSETESSKSSAIYSSDPPTRTKEDLKDNEQNSAFWSFLIRTLPYREGSRLTAADPRFWVNKFSNHTFSSPQEVEDVVKEAVHKHSKSFKKKIDPDTIWSHMKVTRDPLTGKHGLDLHDQAKMSIAEQEKKDAEKWRNKPSNTHLIDSPAFWKGRLKSTSLHNVYDNEKEFNDALAYVVKEFNERNNQKVTVKYLLDNVITHKPHPLSEIGEITPTSHPKAKAKLNAHWNKVFPDMPKDQFDHLIKISGLIGYKKYHHIHNRDEAAAKTKERVMDVFRYHHDQSGKTPEEWYANVAALGKKVDKHIMKFVGHKQEHVGTKIIPIHEVDEA